jgi:hypothetical protein
MISGKRLSGRRFSGRRIGVPSAGGKQYVVFAGDSNTFYGYTSPAGQVLGYIRSI